MRRYETIIIMDPDLSEDGRKPIFERLDALVEEFNGFLFNYDEWGGRRLAYEIKKKNRGYYVCMDYCGAGPLVDEIERFFRIDDRILKFMTILLQEAVDIEALKAEKEKAEVEAKTAREAAAAQAEAAQVEAAKAKAAQEATPSEAPDAEAPGEEAEKAEEAVKE